MVGLPVYGLSATIECCTASVLVRNCVYIVQSIVKWTSGLRLTKGYTAMGRCGLTPSGSEVRDTGRGGREGEGERERERREREREGERGGREREREVGDRGRREGEEREGERERGGGQRERETDRQTENNNYV